MRSGRLGVCCCVGCFEQGKAVYYMGQWKYGLEEGHGHTLWRPDIVREGFFNEDKKFCSSRTTMFVLPGRTARCKHLRTDKAAKPRSISEA